MLKFSQYLNIILLTRFRSFEIWHFQYKVHSVLFSNHSPIFNDFFSYSTLPSCLMFWFTILKVLIIFFSFLGPIMEVTLEHFFQITRHIHWGTILKTELHLRHHYSLQFFLPYKTSCFILKYLNNLTTIKEKSGYSQFKNIFFYINCCQVIFAPFWNLTFRLFMKSNKKMLE